MTCKNLLLVGSNHYALSADHSIPNNTLSKQTFLAEKSGWLATPPLAIVVLDRLQSFKQW